MVFKLSIAVGVLGAFNRLDIGLQTVPHPMQQVGNSATSNVLASALQLGRQVPRALADPAQGRFRTHSSGRFHHLGDGLQEVGLMMDKRFAPGATLPPLLHKLDISGSLNDVMLEVEIEFADWIITNNTLHRLCATT